ncbi:hypothetical protein BG005_003120, partial [Podila minutissima]
SRDQLFAGVALAASLQVPYGTQSTTQYQQQHNILQPGSHAFEYDMTPQQSILGIEAQIHPFAQGASTQQQHRQHHR